MPNLTFDPLAPREAAPIALSPDQLHALKQVIRSVEYYQPLYGLQITPQPLRPCRDRAHAIQTALESLTPRTRLIDFGSSLGYFVFYFADRGLLAEGVDSLPHNIAVAQTVAQINQLPARFSCGELTLDYVRAIPPGRYDIALLLSILHHITHRHGIDYTTELLAELTQRIPTLILELAHRNESVTFPWRDSQPADPLDILARCPNITAKKIGEFPTHLSHIRRPLYRITRQTPIATPRKNPHRNLPPKAPLRSPALPCGASLVRPMLIKKSRKAAPERTPGESQSPRGVKSALFIHQKSSAIGLIVEVSYLRGMIL